MELDDTFRQQNERMSGKTLHEHEVLPPQIPSPTRLRKRLLCAGLVLAVLDLAVMPLVYYYSLTYHSSLSPEYVFIVIVCLFCVLTFVHYTHRCARLVFKCSERYGPLGWRRKFRLLEFTNVNLAICATIFETCLCVGTAFTDPIVRLCTMPPAIICWYFGLLMLGTSILSAMRVRLPFAMSSTPKGARWRPALLAMIEDSNAIEARGETAARAAVLARWDASPLFRQLVTRLNWAWGVGLLLVALVTTVLIFAIRDDHVLFGVGWLLPFVCAFFGVLATVAFVKSSLREERRLWRGVQQQQQGLPQGKEGVVV